MLKVKLQVTSDESSEASSDAFVLHRAADHAVEFAEIPEMSNITDTVETGAMTHNMRLVIPERFCSADITSEGGDVEVATIKEGALRVYSGQRLFPLTFQMPESGLALKDRRWHASMKGGDVRLGSIAATDLEVYTCGGELSGRSLVAGDADIETGGGDIDIGKLMGTFVHVSTEDTEVSNDACGAVKCGAIYADNLHLITGGKGVLIQELNSKDAFVAAPGGAAITVESLAGTCVLSAGGPAPNRAVRPAPSQGVEAHLSGRVGQVMLLSHGGPIKLYLPHTAEQALTVLMRPAGAQSLEDLICSSSEEGMTARLGQWQRLSSFGKDSSPTWAPLDVQGVASLLQQLHAFRGTECCRWLAEDDNVGQSSSDTVREDQGGVSGDHALVLLDAAGGEVSVLQQSWTEMMAAKIGSPGVALKPAKDL
ncbi:g12603 [Coccomyxa viridis]|uniref:G12603 protein n=1 Tax=Coccomyxa viridis TaxID=1274662 RepID=A0ABP1GHT4_9CHLO